MNEIDINIEGYNVNGICVGCLNYNRKMFYHNDITECFKLLGNIDVPAGLTIQVCWECYAAVKRVISFRELIQNSYEYLLAYSRTNTFLDNPEDFERVATTRLAVSQVEQSNMVYIDRDIELKNEIDIELPEIKFEDELTIKEELLGDSIFEFPAAENLDVTSDDDVLLSTLKDKKTDKKTRKKRDKKKLSEAKKARKLINLPKEAVDVYIMTEKEMWSIRTEDVASEDFQSMKYKCVDCIMKFNSKQLMEDHLTKKHQPKGEESLLCDVCNSYFLTKENITAHKRLHLSAYSCTACGFKTTVKRRMQSHLKTHKDLKIWHVCDLCGAQFGSKSKLSYHRSVFHTQRPQCDCCGKVFANKMTLKNHLKVLPTNPEKEKEKLYLPCEGCNKVFESRKAYRSHVIIHKGISYPCPICGKLFQWKRNLARHTRNHIEKDEGAKHECRPCGKTFASRDCYNNHMRLSKRHVGEEAYQHECSYCGKKFAAKWCLTDHIDWDHLKRIKYQCHVCFKSFKTAKIMVAHVNNIHVGKKRELIGEHLCDICGKSYRTVKRLKGHVWSMHTKRSSSKVFKCKLCPATFTWQTSIYKHMKMMHDSNKKAKQPRQPLPVKKEEPYPDMDLANRMYFPQNISNNLNMVHIQTLGNII